MDANDFRDAVQDAVKALAPARRVTSLDNHSLSVLISKDVPPEYVADMVRWCRHRDPDWKGHEDFRPHAIRISGYSLVNLARHWDTIQPLYEDAKGAGKVPTAQVPVADPKKSQERAEFIRQRKERQARIDAMTPEERQARREKRAREREPKPRRRPR